MLDSQLFLRWDSFPDEKKKKCFHLVVLAIFSFCTEGKGKENSSAMEASPLGEGERHSR